MKRSSLFFVIAALAACSHQPELTPAQEAAKEMTAFQAEIRKTVKDSSRAEQLVAMTNEFQELVTATAREESARRAALAAVNADFSATRASYDSLLTRLRAGRRASAAKLVDLRARMAGVATQAEWEQLKKARVKLLDAEMNALAI